MIKSVCGYCGVGCGVEFNKDTLIGDVAYPINEGNLCSKGISELISINTPTRLLRPLLRKSIQEQFNISTWQESIDAITDKIKQTSKEKICFSA